MQVWVSNTYMESTSGRYVDIDIAVLWHLLHIGNLSVFSLEYDHGQRNQMILPPWKTDLIRAFDGDLEVKTHETETWWDEYYVWPLTGSLRKSKRWRSSSQMNHVCVSRITIF